MEPIMKVSVEGPSEFQGGVMGSLNQRRGMIVGTTEEGNYTVGDASTVGTRAIPCLKLILLVKMTTS